VGGFRSPLGARRRLRLVGARHGNLRRAGGTVVKRVTVRPADAGLDGPAVGDWPVAREPTLGLASKVFDAASGELVLITAPYTGDVKAYRAACLAMPTSTTYRASGIRNDSQVFGYVGRRAVLKREGCRACSAADDAPEAHAVLCEAAAHLAEQFAALHPDQAARDRAQAAAVHDDWKLAGSPWTSGVLNKTSALGYHFDRNNFPGSWSAMICLRRGVDGGHLHLPKYDVVIPCLDGQVVYFPGSLLMHGVTPFTVSRIDGYRFTAVYYSVAGMAHCLPAADELGAAQAARTAREDRIAEGIRADV
jgi:hypothetical protein